jgi:phospholipid/cholesterol/gamma-HCH transport system substrate-binding protein
MTVRTTRAAAAGLVVLSLVVGCGYQGPQDMPLPGGVAEDDGYTVTMTFTDATNLVPQETCRANDTVVGSVESVELDDNLDARVVCRIEHDVELPANVVATLRETSLLGERYVALDVPVGEQPQGRLEGGAAIDVSRTLTHPNTELVLGALSQVLNGGSLARVQTITRELGTALEGRTGTARSSARRLEVLMRTLAENEDEIVAVLDQLDRLTRILHRQRDVLATALEQVPDGLAALERQRPRLTRALRRLSDLAESVVPLMRRSRADLVADLRHLRPVLAKLAQTGDQLAPSLERLTSFPFNSNSAYTLKGDYAGAYIQANLDLDAINASLADLLRDTGRPSGPGTERALPELSAPDLGLGPAARPPTDGGSDQAVQDAIGDLGRRLGTGSSQRWSGTPRTLAELMRGPL